MKALNISAARKALPALVESVSTTHAPVMLLRYGKPAAMLVPVQAGKPNNNPYPLRGVPIQIADDFDAPLSGLWDALDVAEAPERYAARKKGSGKAKPKRGKL